MYFKPTEIILKDGRKCILRSPQETDTRQMLIYRKQSVGETDFLLNYPEELADYSLDDQLKFIKRVMSSETSLMLVAMVDGRLAGNCQITFNTKIKMQHRAGIGIALLKEYWGLGIGSAMFKEMIKTAQQRDGVLQLELEVIEGNERAMALYRKFGFEIVAEKPDSIRLKDGRMLKEIFMMKKL